LGQSSKSLFQLEFLYNAVQLLFTWTSLANFYLAFFFLVSSATAPKNDVFNFLAQGAGAIVFEIFLKLYIALLFLVLVCSLGNRPQGSKWIYVLCIVLFGVCNVVTLYCAGFTVWLAVPHDLNGWKNFPA
jgi:chitin synthase